MRKRRYVPADTEFLFDNFSHNFGYKVFWIEWDRSLNLLDGSEHTEPVS